MRPVTISIALLLFGSLGQASDPKLRPLDASALFGKMRGCALLNDLESGTTWRWGTLCEQQFSPCSTFKIPNTLIGLESGAIESPAHRFLWDGKPRSRPELDKEMDLAEAIKLSCVPCFQELARAIGAERMHRYVDRLGYGNRDISAGIDRFWLESSLKISPQQQLDFVAKLWSGALPFKPEVVAALKPMLVQESGDGWSWSGKTGSCVPEDARTPPHGWFVGEAERNGRRIAFVVFERGEGAFGRDARRIARALLEQQGHLPPVP